GAHVLVGEAGAGVAVAEGIAGYAVVGQGDGGAGAAVVDLVDAAGGDGQGPLGDVGGGAGGGVDGVVAGVAARDADAADRHGLAGAHVLVVERRAGVAVGEHVAADPVIGEGDGGRGGAVVDLA